MSQLFASSTRTDRLLGRLGPSLDGKIVLPEHAGWDDARRAWQLNVDQRPAAVVFPESPDDVVVATLFAREWGLRIAAQATGHNAGALGPLEDTVLLKTERMRGLSIDPTARIARADAGTLWRDLVPAAGEHGLTALHGSAPDVGVVGFALGGGISLIARSHGLTANHVRAFEVVTADGQRRRVDREHEPDLFWALRGGGGSFAIVTAIELELLPTADAYAGLLWYPAERAGEVLRAWRDLTDAAPPELSTTARILNVPDLPDTPIPLRGRSFAVVDVYHLGPISQAHRLLEPLRALAPTDDSLRATSTSDLLHIHLDPEQPTPGVGDGWLLTELRDETIDTIVDAAADGSDGRLAVIELRHLEGALARTKPGDGALPALAARYVALAGGLAPTPELTKRVRDSVELVGRVLQPVTAAQAYLNFADTQRNPESFWTPEAYLRLRKVKAAYDPHDVIRSNHPVPLP